MDVVMGAIGGVGLIACGIFVLVWAVLWIDGRGPRQTEGSL